MFPEVTCYAYASPGMGPQGFKPVPLADFTGLDADALTDAEIEGFLVDCEEGLIPLDLSTEDKSELLSLIRSGTVTGKADCVESSGGMYSYSFYDRSGALLGKVMFEEGLLLTDSGRFYLSMDGPQRSGR